METFFLGLFAFGLLFTLASVIIGASHGAADAHAHVQGHGPDWLAHLNFSALMAFVMWFGGAGWLMLKYGPFGLVGALPVGLVAGAGAYSLVAWFVGKLRGSEQVLRPEDYVLDGTVARVTVPVGAGGVGEIVFTLQGVQRVEGARAADGRPLPKGTEVVITGYERGMAIVQDAQTFIHGSPEGERARAREAPPQPERELESD